MRFVFALAPVLISSVAHADPPAQTAGDVPHAVVTFEIRDEAGRPVPARLTFEPGGNRDADLFPNTQADPDELAVRRNVIYTRSGRGAVTVPAGSYRILASRGLEYGLQTLEADLKAGETHRFDATLRREIDTTGWVGGDFHLHTLTHSGHGDANMNERVIALAGEGVEFAVATDHNHHTDYDPVIADLDLNDKIRAVVGNEVSTPIGHFNAFPLDAKRPAPPYDTRDAHALFKLIRAEPNPFDVVPVVQLNHPRWASIDYFTQVGLDPVTGVGSPDFSSDFDTIELLNENEGWGYHDAELAGGMEVGSSRYSVLRDWFNLLNHGHRAAAVGNSDSHNVQSCIAGYPRNFVRSATDAPREIDPAEIANNLRRHEVFTTTGPFVTYDLAPPSGPGGAAQVRVRIQAARWVATDRLLIVVNGDIVRQVDLPGRRDSVRYDDTIAVPLKRDAWITVIVEGDEPLPVIPKQRRPVRPLAICNPTWVDVDRDGVWRSPSEQARLDFFHATGWTWDEAGNLLDLRSRPESVPDDLERPYLDRSPTERALLLLVAGDMPRNVFEETRAAVGAVLRRGLQETDRVPRLAAARAAEHLATPMLADALQGAYAKADGDAYLRIALLRALRTCDPQGSAGLVRAWFASAGRRDLSRYGRELLSGVPGTIVRDWQVAGYFPNPSRATLVGQTYGPETDPDAASFVGKDDRAVRWTAGRGDTSGYLDLGSLPGTPTDAISYARTWLHADAPATVMYAVGTDDGGRMWLNRRLVHEDTGRHGATPFQHVGMLDFNEGWNEMLLKVENGGGPTGLYLRVFDESIRVSAEKP